MKPRSARKPRLKNAVAEGGDRDDPGGGDQAVEVEDGAPRDNDDRGPPLFVLAGESLFNLAAPRVLLAELRCPGRDARLVEFVFHRLLSYLR